MNLYYPNAIAGEYENLTVGDIRSGVYYGVFYRGKERCDRCDGARVTWYWTQSAEVQICENCWHWGDVPQMKSDIGWAQQADPERTILPIM
jgi:late competence protein required for DNA uptake (superfamily II DNA/RNA helicase)